MSDKIWWNCLFSQMVSCFDLPRLSLLDGKHVYCWQQTVPPSKDPWEDVPEDLSDSLAYIQVPNSKWFSLHRIMFMFTDPQTPWKSLPSLMTWFMTPSWKYLFFAINGKQLAYSLNVCPQNEIRHNDKNEKPGDRYVDHVIIYLVKAVKHGSREGKNMLFQQLIRIGERETTFWQVRKAYNVKITCKDYRTHF